MLIKAMGCILILAVSSIVSLILGRSGERRLTAIEETKRLILHITRNIESYLTPVGVILSSYNSEYFENSGFSDAMRSDGLCAAFTRGYLDLPPEAEDLMIGFAGELGDAYADEELKKCRNCLALLEEIESSEKARVEKNRNIYKFLPTLGALSLIIILL